MGETSTTTFLAIWGALLSSITLGWNFFRDIAQRGRLRVSCYIGKIITPGVGVDPKDYLVWSTVNIGKDPIILTNIGGTFKDKHGFIVTTHKPMPITLKQGESFLDYTDDLSVLDDKLLSLWAGDTLNREFKAPRKQIRYLKKTYQDKYKKTSTPTS